MLKDGVMSLLQCLAELKNHAEPPQKHLYCVARQSQSSDSHCKPGAPISLPHLCERAGGTVTAYPISDKEGIEKKSWTEASLSRIKSTS